MCKAIQLTIVLAALSLFTLHCGSKDPLEPETTDSISKVIDQTGGTVSLGGSTILIPTGALDSAVNITITVLSLPVPPPIHHSAPGMAYSFQPHGLTFKYPVTISISYNQLIAEPAMAVLDNPQDDLWSMLDGVQYSNGVASV
jgi:hypothetical protein